MKQILKMQRVMLNVGRCHMSIHKLLLNLFLTVEAQLLWMDKLNQFHLARS